MNCTREIAIYNKGRLDASGSSTQSILEWTNNGAAIPAGFTFLITFECNS